MKTITTFFSIAFLCGLFFENIIKSDKTDKVERKMRNTRRIANIEQRRIVALEKKYTAILRKALKKQYESYANNDTLGLSMVEVLRNLYEVELKYWLQREYKRLNKDTSKAKEDFFNPIWLEWVDEKTKKLLTSKKIKDIDDTTREHINRIIEDGYNRALTRGEIAKEIKKQANSIRTFKRARVIARTELANAVNLAKDKSSFDFEKETGVTMGKTWIHRGGGIPRDEHIALDDGITYPREHQFYAYGEYLGYPHEEGASAENVVNCGCQVVYLRLKD